jgi:Nif-specific regulatory protein
VRELGNEVKRLTLSVEGGIVAEEDLSEAIRKSAATVSPPDCRTKTNLKDMVSDLEKHMIIEALNRSRQNQQHAARTLGLSRQGLIKKMKRYRINGPN